MKVICGFSISSALVLGVLQYFFKDFFKDFFKILLQFHWDKINLKATLCRSDPRPRERTSAIPANFLREGRKSSVFRRTWRLSLAIVCRWLRSTLAYTRCTRCYLSLRHFPRHRGSVSNQLTTLRVCVTTIALPLFVWKQTQSSTTRRAGCQIRRRDFRVRIALTRQGFPAVSGFLRDFFSISTHVWKGKRKWLIN